MNKKKVSKEKIPEIKHHYLAQNENSLFRERIFLNKFLYDLQIAYCSCSSYLHMYQRDIDVDGVDLVLEVGDFQKHLQLKSILDNVSGEDSIKRYSSSTRLWNTWGKFILPNITDAGLFRGDTDLELDSSEISSSVLGEKSLGYGGSIVLQRIHYYPDDKIETFYSIFNFNILCMAISDKFNTRFFDNISDSRKKDELLKKFIEISSTKDKKISIPKWMFINVEKNDYLRLISLIGLPTDEVLYGLTFYLDKYLNCDDPCMKNEMYHRLQCVFSRDLLHDLQDLSRCSE